MASSVFYKFASQRAESRITFDGTGISVFDLKKEIILANGLAKAHDFDLVVLDPASGDEMREDTAVVPRAASVVVKRVPAARPGRGRAAYYTAGVLGAADSAGGRWGNKGAMSRRFDGKDDAPPEPPRAPAVQAATSAAAGSDEAAALAAMFQMQSANWEETQEKMANATRIYTARPGAKKGMVQQQASERPLPASYVCYRCGKKGHWIQDCPTNADREFDNKPRIKRTTGIPRSFLKAVDSPAEGARPGVMVTPEGGYVVAQPDVAAWAKRSTRPKILTEADVRERPPPPNSGLACPIDNRLLLNAVRTPCCGAGYCEDCAQAALLEHDFACPGCGTRIASLARLQPDGALRARVLEHIERAIDESRAAAAAATSSSDPAAQQQMQQGGQGMEFADPEALRAMVAANVAELQAQLAQLNAGLARPDLARDVRARSAAAARGVQTQLAQAQEIEAALALGVMPGDMMGGGPMMGGMGMAGMGMGAPMGMGMGMGNGMGMGMGMMPQGGMMGPPGAFGGPQGQQGQEQQGGDGAYQRLPVNSRRRAPLKRDRPSDFLEVGGADGGEGANKAARFSA